MDTKSPKDLPIKCKFSELIEVKQLVQMRWYSNGLKNPNIHPADQIKQLAHIMNKNGIRHPIIISNQSQKIVAGHGRLEAALFNGWSHFPVEFQDFDSEDLEKAFLLADNKIASYAELQDDEVQKILNSLSDDFDKSLTALEKQLSVEAYANKDADDIPETKTNELGVQLGDLWILGNHRLLCGDATSKEDVERLMAGQKADFCFTSPPYADQRDYSGSLNLEPKHLSKFLEADCAVWAVNLGLKRRNGEIELYWNDYLLKAKELGLPLFSWNVWDRSGEGGSIGAMTAEFPIQHEFIFVFGKIETNRFIPNKSAGRETKTTIRQADGSLKPRFWKSHDFGKLGTIVKNEIEKGKSEVKHPAKFPVSLPTQYILACSDVNGKVYEPFCGSGSTLIACEKTNRKCFGMEIDPHYCNVIIKRWETFSGKKAHKINS